MDLSPTKPTYKMRTCKVTKVLEENYRIKTFEFSSSVNAKPGQFIMLWIPHVGERPMSIGSANPLSLTVANVGKVSSALHSSKQGDLISFRGPIGNSFSLPKNAKNILLVGGGYGVVPLAFLAKVAKEKGIHSTVVIGARKKEDVIYTKNFEQIGSEVLVTTDDGSIGFKANAIEGVKYLIEQKGQTFDAVYSCGPEKMMYYLAKFCVQKGVYCEVSIERYMKCAINICGACAVDGKLACRDGPVFSAKEALKFNDFGTCMRNASGKKYLE